MNDNGRELSGLENYTLGIVITVFVKGLRDTELRYTIASKGSSNTKAL
jgi:hypothetical protein